MRSAIMDIGYNAIRAVVYENDSIGAPEIFNSKFKNDILSLLTSESIDIKHQTYLSIQYLLHIFEKLEVNNIKCVATAVLRNHPRADDFINYIKNKYNFDIDIISGEEEARLSALGLISSIKDSHGIAVDLGGGSLEVIKIEHGAITQLKSFELGTKVISSQNITNEKEIIDIIQESYNAKTYDNLYLMGGALRFMGRLYIDFMGYPLKNLHNLEIPTKDFATYLDKLQSSTQDTKNKLWRRRINQNAIIVVKALINVFQSKNIIISTYGLKEGVRISDMSEEEKQKDIVFEKVQYTCNFNTQNLNWESYFDIIIPLLSKKANYQNIIKLAIMLLSLQHKFDSTLHSSAISEFVLSSEIPFTHKTRIMLALILSYSTNYKPHNELIRIAKRIIDKNDQNNCQIIGHYLWITEAIDGPIFTTPSFSINMQNHYLEINSKEILPRPIFDKICTRLKSIAFARKMNFNILKDSIVA